MIDENDWQEDKNKSEIPKSKEYNIVIFSAEEDIRSMDSN